MGDDRKNDRKRGAGPRFSKWSFRIVVTGLMALLAYYAQQKSVTVAQLNVSYARIPLLVIFLALVFDYGLDSGKLYDRMVKKPSSRMFGLVEAVAIVGVFFLVFTWLVAGSVTTNVAPSTLVVSGIISLIVLLPSTGSSEWILWLWVAETIVTQGHYLSILPHFLNLSLGGL